MIECGHKRFLEVVDLDGTDTLIAIDTIKQIDTAGAEFGEKLIAAQDDDNESGYTDAETRTVAAVITATGSGGMMGGSGSRYLTASTVAEIVAQLKGQS